MNKNLLNTLIFLRKSNNYSQKEFAKKINMSDSTYNRIESGLRPITTDDLQLFLQALNIDYFDFFSCLLEIELDNTQTTTHYQTILKKSKDPENNDNLNKSFDYFKEYHATFSNNKYPINTVLTSYIQLSFLFPTQLNQINKNELNEIAKRILKKNYWAPTDYLVIAIIIPHLNHTNADTIFNKIITIDPINYSKDKHKYIHSLIQNLIDYYLVNYNFYENSDNINTLNTLFLYWKQCLNTFNDIEADIIYKHMHDMFSFLYSLENKEIIYTRCEKRILGLEYLGISTLKNAIEEETQDYYNQDFGNLKCVMTNTSNNINQNLYLDK